MKWRAVLKGLLILLFAFPLSGCDKGETQASVKGNVVFDGTPVQDGLMRFEPRDGTSAPRSQPLRDGKYEVLLDPGPYQVRITAGDQKKMGPVPSDPNASGPEFIPLLPDSWNTASEMLIEVAPGDNAFDFLGDRGKPPSVESPGLAASSF